MRIPTFSKSFAVFSPMPFKVSMDWSFATCFTLLFILSCGAVRNTNIDGMEIHEGDIMGIGDSGMLAVGQNVNETVLETLKRMVEDESELISVYFGEDVTEEDAEALVEKVQTAFPNCEVELNDGGQPIYYYLLSVE